MNKPIDEMNEAEVVEFIFARKNTRFINLRIDFQGHCEVPEDADFEEGLP